MECQNCHKNGFVIIGNKRYCSNCGSKLDGQKTAPRAMSDIKPASGPLDLSAAKPVAASATQLHGKQVGSSASKAPALDLRPGANTAQAPEVPTKDEPPQIQPPAGPTATPPPAAVMPQVAGVNAVTAATAPAPVVAPATSAEPTPPAAAPTPMAPRSTDGLHPLVKRFPSHPAVQAKQAPAPAPVVPNSVAAPAEPISPPVSPALEHALENAAKVPTPSPVASSKPLPGLASAAAAVAAIAIIGGLIWMQNSPKLAFRSAASQAGVQASLPTYIPSSYRQVGPAQAAPGQLTLSFQSNAQDSKLQIIQRRTAWDSNSLRENYVSHQSDEYLAVQGQGLTIYVFGDRASWVNHGVWYTVEGTSKLSREQVLKVAYGL